jgi:hypothetical protein
MFFVAGTTNLPVVRLRVYPSSVPGGLQGARNLIHGWRSSFAES